ncbi:MAG: hypothetical protein ACE5J6_03535 [Candidatus Bathyarchaeia archaeon]
MAFNELKTFIKLTLAIALILIVLPLVFSYFLAMFLGPVLLFSPEGLTISSEHRRLPILLFVIIGFYTPVALNIGLVFLLLWGVFVICFVAAWKLRESFHGVIEKRFPHPMKKLFDNWLFAMPVVTSMMLTAVIAIHSFQEAHGVPTGKVPLPKNHFEALFELSYAALIEEIGFRLTPIGAFLIVYLFWVGRKNVATLSWGERLKLFLTAPLYPEKAKKMVGVKTVSDFGVRGGISLGEWIMVFFTSTIFGLAHYLSSGGWEIGKVTSASIVGLAMGLTYLLYGFQAPILLHWFFNYYLQFFNPQLALEFYPSLFLAFFLVEPLILILGEFGWLFFIILGLHKMFRALTKRVKSRLTQLPRTS